MIRNRIRPLALFVGTALALAGCSENPSGPESREEAMARLAGDYTASGAFGAIVFTTTTDGETIDWLDEGAFLQIRLTADGATSGRVFVPGVDEDGGDFDEDLTGTWELIDDEIFFEHDADTFIRDMPFEVDGNRLIGDRTFEADEVRVQVELVRQ